MPLPFLIAAGAAVVSALTSTTAIATGAAVATGLVAKKIYDATKDDNSNSETKEKVVSGPSKEELKSQQRIALYEQLKQELSSLWKNTDYLLCLKDRTAAQHCEKLSVSVRHGKMTPPQALGELHSREANKSQVLKAKLKMPAPQNFFRGTLNDTASLIRRINANLDDSFAPRMALADNYDLCRDEHRSEFLRKIFAPCQCGNCLAPLPDDCASDYPDLSVLWHNARLLEEANAEGAELRVVVCGMLKAGKSSLLNSLFDDREDALFKVGITRATTENQIQVKDGIRFIDTPGLEANQEDTQEARKAYQSADLLLFVHNGERELVKQELNLLRTLRNENGNLEQRLVMVISHIDLTGDAIARLTEKVREQLKSAFDISIPIHAVSNKRYKKSFEPGKEALRKKSGIDELRRYIYGRKDSDMSILKTAREAKHSSVYSKIDDWISTFSHGVSERRSCLKKELDEIFTVFNDNVLTTIRSQLKELR